MRYLLILGLLALTLGGCGLKFEPTDEPDCYKVPPSAVSWGGYDCSRKADGTGKY